MDLTGALRHGLHGDVRVPGEVQRHARDLRDARGHARPEVDHLAAHARERRVQRGEDPVHAVLDVQPVPRGGPASVEGQRLAEQDRRQEPRDALLQVLAGPVVVEGPDDRRGQVVGADVRVHQAVGARLRRRVGARRQQRVVLVHRLADRAAVDLAGRDVNEPLDRLRVLEDRVRDRLGAHHVRLEEDPVVRDGAPDVALGREVDDLVRLRRQPPDQRQVVHVPVPELEPRVVPHLRREVGEVPRVREGVQHQHADVWARPEDALDERGPDEPGPSGDEQCPHHASVPMDSYTLR